MTLLLLLKPIYQDAHDPGIPAKGIKRRAKKVWRKFSRTMANALPSENLRTQDSTNEAIRGAIRALKEQEQIARDIHTEILRLRLERRRRLNIALAFMEDLI